MMSAGSSACSRNTRTEWRTNAAWISFQAAASSRRASETPPISAPNAPASGLISSILAMIASDRQMSKRIAIVGAGALGGYVGGTLAHVGLDVTLIDAWPEHVETIRS